MKHSKKLVMVVAGAVAALTLGSLAFAAIPDAGGVIHGCYDKASGHLRVTDSDTNLPKTCTSKEAALDWNQQGPKGDRGPSNAYTKAGSSAITATSNFGTTVLSRTLPAGKYLLSAKLTVWADALNVPPTIVHCALSAFGGAGGSADFAEGTVSSNGSGKVIVSSISLENDNTDWVLANGGTVSLDCDSLQPALAHAATITALQVGSLD
jgi:hypothetical protein